MLLEGLGKVLVEMIFADKAPRTNLSKRKVEEMVAKDAFDMSMCEFFGKYCDMMAFTEAQAEEDKIQGLEDFIERHTERFYMWKLRLAKFLLNKLVMLGSHKIKKYKHQLEYEVTLDANYLSCLQIFGKYGIPSSVAELLSSFEEDTEHDLLVKKQRLGSYLIDQVLEDDATRREYPIYTREHLEYEVKMNIEDDCSLGDMWAAMKSFQTRYWDGRCGEFNQQRLDYEFRSNII